jgi:rubrerythrin
VENNLETYGDLKQAIQSIAKKQKTDKIAGVAADAILDFVPGYGAAKTTFQFIKAAVTKPDGQKSQTWLDRLDIDDKMAAIVDNNVENGFMQTIAKAIDKEPNDKKLELDFNMNAKMVNYLQDKYQGRHIAGIKESKIDKDKLSQIKKGIEVEMEHTDDPKIALKIALDHIKEDPKYYDKLIKAGLEELNEGEFCPQCLAEYIKDHANSLQEAEYKGRKVQLGKPMAGDIKKFKVYVKNAKGNVVKVNFGQKGVKIKKNNPERRKSFRARHHCDTNPGPRWKARYWSCRKW